MGGICRCKSQHLLQLAEPWVGSLHLSYHKPRSNRFDWGLHKIESFRLARICPWRLCIVQTTAQHIASHPKCMMGHLRKATWHDTGWHEKYFECSDHTMCSLSGLKMDSQQSSEICRRTLTDCAASRNVELEICWCIGTNLIVKIAICDMTTDCA